MVQNMADPCRNCGAALSPGAAFCLVCGATVANRAASTAPSVAPLGGSAPSAPGFGAPGFGAPGFGAPGFGAPGFGAPSAPGFGAASAPSVPGSAVPGQALPGIITVGSTPSGPLLPPVQVGQDPRAAAATALSNAAAGRRLAAKIIDGVPPGILFGVAGGVGAALITTTTVQGGTQVDFTWLSVLMGVASVLSLAYAVWQWVWEARAGKTLGNLMLGLRTTNMEGTPAGLLAIFLRSLMVSLSGVVPTIGPIVMLVSNAWDKNDKKQGWHDKVAHTLVFNVSKGRNPLETGGIAERETFTPTEVPTLSPVRSPLVRPAAPTAGQAHAGQFPPGQTQMGQAQMGQAQAGQTQVGQAQAGQAPAPGAAAAVPARRLGRGKKKGAAVDPFAPPAIQFQNQPSQAQAPAQFQNQPSQAQAPGQFQNQQPVQQFQQTNHLFAPPPSALAPELPIEQGPITTVPGITRPLAEDTTAPDAQTGQPFQQPQQFQQPQPPQRPQQPQQPAQGMQAQGFASAGAFAPAPASRPGPADAYASTPFDDEAGETRARPQGSRTAVRLVFDDGRTEELGATALLGRNPAGYDGEMISRLIPIQDSTRSVSKTHLHVRAAAEGLWVTDRNSTNGSAIANTGGVKTPLIGGTPTLAVPGSRVHFGDRSFAVEQV
ncbi:putative RDD family membrane protein YckC [Arthrobacter sp. UYCu511]